MPQINQPMLADTQATLTSSPSDQHVDLTETPIESHPSARVKSRRAKPAVRRVPRQERSKVLVDCIRIAAAEILQKDGPKALTTNNIAARAGVSIGSLYQYFANKEQILQEVFREHADRNFEDSREWASCTHSLPLREVIALMVERAVTRHREFHSFHPEFYQRHHRELHIGLRPKPENNGIDGEPYAVAWLRGVFSTRLNELRVPDARLASVALAHSVSSTLHGIVENDASLLYEDGLAENLTDMACGLVVRDEPVGMRHVTHCNS
ncbi:MAG: AcrR family transcriptional regulator [Myxococcota bacterium]|jgi:AcrR family transcriptional regulator